MSKINQPKIPISFGEEWKPDGWTVIKINPNDGTAPYYKVFGSWLGGYSSGDSWRLNSGITEVVSDGDWWVFKGWSGSLYYCHKDCYDNHTSYPNSVLDMMIRDSEDVGVIITRMPKETDWLKLVI